MKSSGRGQLEQRLLVLVTLALVAFGLVMVYSATSAAAALGKGDPVTFLKRQGIYALVGVALMLVASRFDHRPLRSSRPARTLTALAPVRGPCSSSRRRWNGARRWLDLGRRRLPPSSSRSWLCSSGRRATSPAGSRRRRSARALEADRHTRPRRRPDPVGAEPRRDDCADADARGCSSSRASQAGNAQPHRHDRDGRWTVAISIEPYRRARFLSFLDPSANPENAASRRSRR